MPVKLSDFNKEHNIIQFTISNVKESLIVKVLNYGATITNILFHDNKNKQRDLVLGFDDYAGYLRKDNPYFGATVGRYGNRIAKGQFTLDSHKYQLPINLTPNTLHGGIKGFDKNIWSLKSKTDNSITLDLASRDGDENFPGAVIVSVTFTVTDDNQLRLEYTGELLDEKQTIINLTNHSYFNLNGITNENEVSILNHVVSMSVDQYLEVDETLIPTGKINSTKDHPVMDFSMSDAEKHPLSARIPAKIDGYDHCYVIDSNQKDYNIKGGKEELVAVVVRSPITGIALTFSTTEPGFQFYSGNVVSDLFNAKSTQSAKPLKLATHAGFALEAQRFPDAINQEKFKNQVILKPKNKYEQRTSYKFSVTH